MRAILPEELTPLPTELARDDALLDGPVFFAPNEGVLRPADRAAIDAHGDLPAVDFGKFRYRLGFESLCREVWDSILRRQFRRIGIDQPVPHPTTLMKLTSRCGSAERSRDLVGHWSLISALRSRLKNQPFVRGEAHGGLPGFEPAVGFSSQTSSWPSSARDRCRRSSIAATSRPDSPTG